MYLGSVWIKFSETCTNRSDCHKGRSLYIRRSLDTGSMAQYTGPHEAPGLVRRQRKRWKNMSNSLLWFSGEGIGEAGKQAKESWHWLVLIISVFRWHYARQLTYFYLVWVLRLTKHSRHYYNPIFRWEGLGSESISISNTSVLKLFAKSIIF